MTEDGGDSGDLCRYVEEAGEGDRYGREVGVGARYEYGEGDIEGVG